VSYLEPLHSGKSVPNGTAAGELVAAAQDERRRQERQGGFAAVFDRSTVFVEIEPETGGIVVYEHADGLRWVHAYSTFRLIPAAKFSDPEDVWHRQLTGAALRAALGNDHPDVGVVFDRGTPHEQRLPVSAPVRRVERRRRS
jgi:hypothetical protein